MKNTYLALLLAVAIGVSAEQSAVLEVQVLNEPTSKEKELLAKLEAEQQQEKEILLPQPSYVFQGGFRENFERLAIQWDFAPVIWDEKVHNCVWEQVTEYEIKDTKTGEPFSDSRDVLFFYADTLDFVPRFNDIDKSVVMIYQGPENRVSDCAY